MFPSSSPSSFLPRLSSLLPPSLPPFQGNGLEDGPFGWANSQNDPDMDGMASVCVDVSGDLYAPFELPYMEDNWPIAPRGVIEAGEAALLVLHGNR